MSENAKLFNEAIHLVEQVWKWSIPIHIQYEISIIIEYTKYSLEMKPKRPISYKFR